MGKLVPKSVSRIGKQLLDRLFEDKKNEQSGSQKSKFGRNGSSEGKLNMIKGKGTRLSRIARDLSVGISTIVEFLHKKGLDIDTNPNSKVPAEYYDLLVKEFSSDSEIKKQSEKLSRSMRIRKQSVSIKGDEATETDANDEQISEDAGSEPIAEDTAQAVPDTETEESIPTEKEDKPVETVQEKVEETPEPVAEKIETPEPVAEIVEAETVVPKPADTKVAEAENVVSETSESDIQKTATEENKTEEDKAPESPTATETPQEEPKEATIERSIEKPKAEEVIVEEPKAEEIKMEENKPDVEPETESAPQTESIATETPIVETQEKEVPQEVAEEPAQEQAQEFATSTTEEAVQEQPEQAEVGSTEPEKTVGAEKPLQEEEKTSVSPEQEKTDEKVSVKKHEAKPTEAKPTKAEEKEATEIQPNPIEAKEKQEEKTDDKAEAPKDKDAQSGDFKVVGKIDLSTLNQKTRPNKKSRREKERERQEKERAKKDAQSEWRKKVQSIHTPDGKEQPKKRPTHGKAAPTKPGDGKKDESQEKIFKTDVQKLSGPTVVGKIELPVTDKRRGKSKPVASSSNEDSQAGKKRRKRIRKDRVDINKKQQSPDDKKAAASKKPRPKKRPLRTEVSEEDVQKQIKDTLARLTSKGKSKASKHRRTKRDDIRARQIEDMEKEAMEKNILKVNEFVSVNELATMMDIPVNKVIGACMGLGLFVSINQRLDAETLTLVADEFGFEISFTTVEEEEAIIVEDNEEDLVPRPPIVTVMGHVDHGKTSLLDHIRKANVIAGEAGGITQHIGAYSVELSNGKNISFLDTPGHEAFTAMRARGAKVTDIAIIVVAADDNVMPQTVEAINHASAAGVPIIFAINKVDKPGANPDKIKEELANMNYLVEEWGGKYQSQDISAKFGTNVDDLLEKVLLEAEMLELKGNPQKAAHGTIIESSLDKGRGYVATILVQSGTLKVGDIILAGTYTGHVKAMFNERNKKITEAGPSVPALILGLNGAPQAGDNFNVMSSEREAREIANKREQLMREQSLRTQKHITLDEIGRRLALGDFHEVNVIVKGDVDGSIEALSDSLIKQSTDSVQVNIKHKAVGQISESDVMLAMASNAIIVGFQVRPSMGARKLAEKEQIDIRLYSIIYDAINEMRDAMEGMLSPDLKEEIVATLEIRETFKITKVGTIAGCMVKEGKIHRNSKVRLIREGIVIYTGELGSLKRFKDDVKEVASGYECGLNIANFNDIKVGDIVEAFTEVEVKKKL